MNSINEIRNADTGEIDAYLGDVNPQEFKTDALSLLDKITRLESEKAELVKALESAYQKIRFDYFCDAQGKYGLSFEKAKEHIDNIPLIKEIQSALRQAEKGKQ